MDASTGQQDGESLRPDLRAGVANMLRTCGGLAAGDSLLILHEPAELDYYDPGLPGAVAAQAQQLGLNVRLREVPFDPMGTGPSAEVAEEMRMVDRVLFLARLGDQMRFGDGLADVRAIMCYALDEAALSSGFGQADYRGFVALKEAVDRMIGAARSVRVTCPLGTDFHGSVAPRDSAPADVNVDRFPMLVFAPVPVARFSGVVVQDGFLVGTGSTFYQPYACPLDAPIRLRFEGTALTGIEGEPADVAAARAHYAHVGALCGHNPMTVHSWHAGLHPACAFHAPAAAGFERWSGAAFGNPRLLHLHSCGDVAPGEISLNILDPTVRVDGVDVWADGRFHPERVPGGRDVLARYPSVRASFAAPVRQVGQGPEGRLSGR